MGYTHYWTFNRIPLGKTALYEKRYQRAITECYKVIQSYQDQCARDGRDSDRLSGYAAHTDRYGGLQINGKGELSCEDFIMREHLTQNHPMNFCKTLRFPYDRVVTACLAILTKHRIIRVTSDGKASDWVSGVTLARKVLKNKNIVSPVTI